MKIVTNVTYRNVTESQLCMSVIEPIHMVYVVDLGRRFSLDAMMIRLQSPHRDNMGCDRSPCKCNMLWLMS